MSNYYVGYGNSPYGYAYGDPTSVATFVPPTTTQGIKMANVVISNFTTQKPNAANGLTGAQVLTMIPASRVFVKVAESTTAAPVYTYAAESFKTNGQTPVGWTDLGIMDAPAKITYTKDIEKVKTGIDQYIRKTYAKSKEASLDFSLWQTDDLLLSNLGFNGSSVTSGSSMNFLIGQEDVVTLALLCVYQNKLDGKEMHIYHPAANLSVTFDTANDKLLTKVSADLLAFTPVGATVDALFSTTIFA